MSETPLQLLQEVPAHAVLYGRHCETTREQIASNSHQPAGQRRSITKCISVLHIVAEAVCNITYTLHTIVVHLCLYRRNDI